MTSKIQDKRVYPKRVLVTAALPYSNGRLHVGHIVGAYLPSDTYVRYLKLRGVDVRFICGSDDHGVAIVLTAQKEGKTPAEVSAFYKASQARSFERLGIDFDIYSSTSANPLHAPESQRFFKMMVDKGYFEKQTTRQFYDDSKQTFLPDRFVKGDCGYCGASDQNGDQCENCGKMLDLDTLKNARSVMSGEAASVRETVHWFLDLSRFKDDVANWISNATLRDHTKSYVEGLLGAGLVKRSMTRDLDWGIPVPLDDNDAKGKVLYVWFDAPIGYISNTMELCANRGADRDGNSSSFKDWWASDDSEIFHFIGEDNTIFHCLVWIAMLQAEGSYHLPKGVIVNQFMNIKMQGSEETKISKSRGTAIWIDEFLDSGMPPDSLRYYLTLIATEKAKTAYKPEDLIQRYNTDLANVVGNLVNRVISFTRKHYGPAVPARKDITDEFDTALVNELNQTHDDVTNLLDTFQFKAALERVMEFARGCNKYLDDRQPWTLRKSDPDGAAHILSLALSSIKALSIMLTPFIPFSTEKIYSMLCLNSADIKWEDAKTPLPEGAPLGEPVILFEKIISEVEGE